MTSFYRLRKEKYRELKARYPNLPSHYIYTAWQVAVATYKHFRVLKREKKAKKDRPVFRGSIVVLDDKLHSLDLYRWQVRISTPQGRLAFNLLHGDYHEKFRKIRIVKRALKVGAGAIAMEDIEGLRCRIRHTREMNGRLHRWSYSRYWTTRLGLQGLE